MKTAIARLILAIGGLTGVIASLVNSIKIQSQPDLSPGDRESAMLMFSLAPLIAGAAAMGVSALLPRILDLWQNRRSGATGKQPFQFSLDDPARGVQIYGTLTDTGTPDAEGRKKIGTVLQHYGSGGVA